jgi:ParB family transcriptional regulator, chromosome partitioning protein
MEGEQVQSLIAVNPFRCKVWDLHDRLEEQITEESCAAEIHSFEEHGQLVPALGRRLRKGSEHEIELICGARRLFVARLINKPLLVEVRDMSDRDAIIAMDMENRHRLDVSPYERGISYARWLRAGFFESQEDLARALNISASQVSRLLKLASLPSVIVNAFSSALEICEGWGVELADALQDPDKRHRTISEARFICASTPRPAGREVYRQLISSAVQGRRPRAMSHDRVVKAQDGTPLFRIRHQRTSIAVILPVEKISAKCLQAIEASISRILQSQSVDTQAPNHVPERPQLHAASVQAID